MVPALAETITELGLVLVADTSNETGDPNDGTAGGWSAIPDGINGILKDNGILRFHDTIDM
jgi:CDK inhibitor PHO81